MSSARVAALGRLVDQAMQEAGMTPAVLAAATDLDLDHVEHCLARPGEWGVGQFFVTVAEALGTTGLELAWAAES